MDLFGENRLDVLRSRLASCEVERLVLLAIIKSATSDIRKDAFTEYTGVLMNIRLLNREIIEVENRQPDTSGASHV